MKKTIAVILILSLAGLGAIQYRFLLIGLKYANARFSQQMGLAMQSAREGLSYENQLTTLLAATVMDEPGQFSLSLDSLKEAGRSYFRDYLKDRMLSQGLDVEFGFALTDVQGKKVYLQSENYEAGSGFVDYRGAVSGFIADHCRCTLYMEVKARNLLSYLLGQLHVLIILCVAFFGLVAICFLWLLYLLRQQSLLDEVKNDFINNLTHELKTPVFTIGMTTKMLQENCASERDFKYLEIIREENELLKRHIEKVLELASMESGRHVMELKRQDVHPVLESIAENFRAQVEQQNGRFRYLPEAGQPVAMIDATHLGNAVQNLLDNALKFSPEPAEIELRTYNLKGGLCIAVKDNGRGIAREHRKKVFHKFYRAPAGNLPETQGYGLGLSYVRQAARLHNGQARVESSPGKGSTFIITIPSIE